MFLFKFIHCADLHLDSPLRGLSMKSNAPVEQIRTATRRALNNLVDLCIQEEVQFLVIAGDVYDGDWPDYTTGLFFSACMGKLREHHIAVYLIRGNHDAESTITKKLVLPSNVIEFSSQQPETYLINDIKVALHGQSFWQREVRDNLASTYPEAMLGYFNIGILHTAAEGQEGHEAYAPCRINELVQKGYDYWALGHIHKRQILHEKPYVVFPGNLQGRHIRETGHKGCTLVTVDGTKVFLEHQILDVLRWYVCEVDLTDVDTDEELNASICVQMERLLTENQGYPLALRVRFSGQTRLHGYLLQNMERYIHEVQNAAAIMAGDLIWIEKVKFSTEPIGDMEGSQDQDDAIATLLQSRDSALTDPEFLDDFLKHVNLIQGRIGKYTQSSDATVIATSSDVEPLLKDAQSILLNMLGKGNS